jgi:DNA-binding IclR family transcriptional regulator
VTSGEAQRQDPAPAWTFLSNHGAVLLHVARSPETTIREIAAEVGITERAAARILKDLRNEGYVESTRVGRRNTYRVNLSLPRRREPRQAVADLLRGLLDDTNAAT